MSDLDGFERIQLMLSRADKEPSRAREQKYYGYGGDPARHVKFEREKKAPPAVTKPKGKR